MGLRDRVKKTQQVETTPVEVTPDTQAALADKQQKLEDVLELLRIPSTYEVPDYVFLSEDITAVHFDVQVPRGYDEGQVMNFVSQARTSIKFLEALLRKRNEDVAKLASVIDKLQVDANNLRWESEIANGVSVMPTMDESDLENQLMEARLRVRSLEDEVEKLQAQVINQSGLPVAANGVPQEAYEKVADELSLSRRRNEALEEELLHLKTKLALQEDEEEDELGEAELKGEPLSPADYDLMGISLPEPTTHITDDEVALPEAALSARPLSPALPEVPPAPQAAEPAARPSIKLPPAPAAPSALESEDEDDDLDALMRDLQSE